MKIDRTAPVQGEPHLGIPGGRIPWAIHLLAVKDYNKFYNQTAEELAARGGLSWCELIAHLRGACGNNDHIPHNQAFNTAYEELRAIMEVLQ